MPKEFKSAREILEEAMKMGVIWGISGRVISLNEQTETTNKYLTQLRTLIEGRVEELERGEVSTGYLQALKDTMKALNEILK